MTSRARLLPVLLACTALVVAGCGSSGGSGQASGSSPSATPSGPCTYTSEGQPARKVSPPSSTPVVTGTTRITLTTNHGVMPVRLDASAAPCAVNAILSLTEQRFFDKTICHRVAVDDRGFHILQCGDPTGTGTGGPGYRYAEEVTGKETYPPGTVAMANAGSAGTTGSQFFIIFGTTKLPPQYTVIGKLSPSGVKVAKKLGAIATKGKGKRYDGAPASPIRLLTVTEG